MPISAAYFYAVQCGSFGLAIFTDLFKTGVSAYIPVFLQRESLVISTNF